MDGLGTGAALNGGGVSTYVADISNAQEVVTTNSGGLGEAEVGGPAMNIVPKERRQHAQRVRFTCPACRRRGWAATTPRN